MEYRVLSRKWRPQIFADVIGQDHIVKTLTNAIHQNRIAHAFIFSGPRGVGKTSIARILAKALNCVKGPAEIPCNECSNCREITEGISMDVQEIDGASNRGIDEIRELRENVKFSPATSRYKIYIIDEVHMLTREAFNALLKTLEEPPSRVVFIFATTEVHKIPATIQSRCQCFDFRRISLKQIRDNLRMICKSEGVSISEAGLMWIAEAGDGSARDAQSILDQLISYAGNDIEDQDIRELLSITDRRFLFTFSEAILARDAEKCLKNIEEAYYAGIDMKFFYQMLLHHFRNLLLVKILGDHHGLIELTDDEVTGMKEQIKDISRETIERHLDILMGEEENVRKSYDPRLNLEAILVRMAYLEPIIPFEQIISRIEELEQRLSSIAKLGRMPDEISTAAKSKAEQRDLFINSLREPNSLWEENRNNEKDQKEIIQETKDNRSHWGDFLNFVRNQNPLLCSKIETGEFQYEDRCLKILFPQNYIFFDDLNEGAQKTLLTEIVKAFLQEDVTIKIETLESKDHVQQESKGFNDSKIHEIKSEALRHPLVQKVLDVFSKAEVREVIVRTNINNQNDLEG